MSKYFFDIKGLGLLSSLFRFFFFFVITVIAEVRSKEFELTFKRISILCLLLVVLPSLMVWNHVGFFLDDIFYPEWKNQLVEKPLFIVGNARSGTTWFHRLIASDSNTFTSFR
jgi:hypothetical protein